MDVEKVERLHMRATRMVKQFISYWREDILKVINLPTLKYRRLKGDVIQVYNIISAVHDSYSSLHFIMSSVSITRGNQFKMQLTHIHYNMQKHFFTDRVIDAWNRLPGEVISALNIFLIFKSRLDKFWYIQDLKSDWKVEIFGIGSRSLKFSKTVYNI